MEFFPFFFFFNKQFYHHINFISLWSCQTTSLIIQNSLRNGGNKLHRIHRKMWFVVPYVRDSTRESHAALIYKHKKRCYQQPTMDRYPSQHPVVLDQCHLYRSQEPGQIDTLRSQFGVFSILFFLINNSITM